MKIPHTKTMRWTIAALAVLATAPTLAGETPSTAPGSGATQRQVVKDERKSGGRPAAAHREDGGGRVGEQDAAASSPRAPDPGRDAGRDGPDAFGLHGPG